MSAPDLAAVPDEPPQTVELAGRTFRLDDRGVSLMGLMEFAELARRQGQSTSGQDEMDTLAALLGLLEECIAADEWDAFRAHARQVRADADALNAVMTDAVAAKAARPTRPPSGSPDGRSTTGTNSAAGSSSPASSTRVGDLAVQRALEDDGRPDMALVVKRARQAASATSSTG
jgi:hypothetical protein